jgi:hypothetical protein
LDAIGSTFLPVGSVINPKVSDLVLAASVCATLDPFQAVRPTFLDGWRIIKLTNSRKRYAKELMAWQAYVMDTAQHPRIGGKPSPHRKDRGLDWTLSVVVSLMEMGFTEEQAWTMPEGRAMYYYFAKAIREGAELDITTTSMEDKLPEAKAMVDAAIAAAKARAGAG